MLTRTRARTVEPEVAQPTVVSAAAGAMHARIAGVESVQGRTVATARVNLLPPEVLMKRRVRAIRRRIGVAIAVVIVAGLAALGWARVDESHAVARLDAEQSTVDAMKRSQQKYGDLLRVSTEGRSIDRSLASVMSDHVEWDRYLSALAVSAPPEIELTGVQAILGDVGGTGVDPETASGGLDTSGQEHIGSLTVTGLAPTHEIVAAWAESLTDIEGFLVPYILDSSAVVEGDTSIQFSIEITLSSAIRSGRYVVAVPATTEGQGG